MTHYGLVDDTDFNTVVVQRKTIYNKVKFTRRTLLILQIKIIFYNFHFFGRYVLVDRNNLVQ